MHAAGLPNGNGVPPLHPRAAPPEFAKAEFEKASTSKPVKLPRGPIRPAVLKLMHTLQVPAMPVMQALAYEEPLEQARARHARAWKVHAARALSLWLGLTHCTEHACDVLP